MKPKTYYTARMRLLYGLLLAYQAQPFDVTSLPWTRRRIKLIQCELDNLQLFSRTGAKVDEDRAKHFRELLRELDRKLPKDTMPKNKKPTILVVTAEDFTAVGGPMGSDTRRPPYFVEYFFHLEDAKARCAEHYTGRKLVFRKDGKNKWTTGDLGHVCYNIEQVEVK